jgi:hypothetical protein
MSHYLQFADLNARQYTYLFDRASVIKKNSKPMSDISR